MTPQEAERRRQVERDEPTQYSDHRVLSFRQWCELNGFSVATGRRLISAGEGPIITQLSARRIGITIANNCTWQASRARKTVAA
jgi:hypothetical protein